MADITFHLPFYMSPSLVVSLCVYIVARGNRMFRIVKAAFFLNGASLHANIFSDRSPQSQEPAHLSGVDVKERFMISGCQKTPYLIGLSEKWFEVVSLFCVRVNSGS